MEFLGILVIIIGVGKGIGCVCVCLMVQCGVEVIVLLCIVSDLVSLCEEIGLCLVQVDLVDLVVVWCVMEEVGFVDFFINSVGINVL